MSKQDREHKRLKKVYELFESLSYFYIVFSFVLSFI
uniref:Uncharacterized protein n=1 Tax=Arundo donax TaxID=35708 RepID=A0A0A8ZEW9_ARUDO